MAKLLHTSEPIQWSEEELRQRGVRAVVAAMRLNKEHRRLSVEHACFREQNRVLREYIKQLKSLNEAARELIKRCENSRTRNTKIRNTWINNGDFYSGNGSSSKGH
jgi:23S rRNA maturation mini-RNase III